MSESSLRFRGLADTMARLQSNTRQHHWRIIQVFHLLLPAFLDMRITASVLVCRSARQTSLAACDSGL